MPLCLVVHLCWHASHSCLPHHHSSPHIQLQYAFLTLTTVNASLMTSGGEKRSKRHLISQQWCMYRSYCCSGSGAWLGVSLGQSHPIVQYTTTEVAWGSARLRSQKSTDLHKMKRRQSAKIREDVELMLSLVSFALLSCLSAFKSQITWLHGYEVHDAPHPTFTRAPLLTGFTTTPRSVTHCCAHLVHREKLLTAP